MDGIIAYALSKAFTKKTVIGMGAIKGAPCTITSIVDNLDGTHDITFSWKDNNDVTHTSVLTVVDGETPSFSSVVITGGHRLTFTTQNPSQSVSFNVMDGAEGETGVSVVASNVDENNNLTLTLSNGNVINAGKIKAVTTVDNALSTTSTNPVENKVITNALNGKVDKEMGKGLFSNEEKTKLENIEDGAQVNVLEKLIVNGQEATITDKSIALTLITSAVSNLQNYYLKTETYTKQEVEDLIGQTVGVTIEIVEQLPTEGQSNVIYFLPTETEGVYSQYIYTTDGWILIGSTTVDLSNYYTKAQVDTLLNGKQNVLTIDSFPTALSNNPVASGGVYTAIAQMQPQFQFSNMPIASASNLGFVYQYIGATGTYTQNMFYRCVYDSTLGEYKWEEVIFHAVVTVDSELSPTSTNPVQNKVVKEALDTKQDIMQYSTMPSAQDNLGKVVQYIGTNTANYTNGYFYKAIYDSESDVYLWTVIKFSADMLVDNALSTTSENPVQNKVITGTINGIQDVIPSEASSANKLVDRDSLGTASQKDFTPYVSPDNTDVPISSSVYSAITNAVYGAYHPSGSKTIAELTSDLLVLANIGNVYKITEDGVTTDLFIGGTGQTIHTGDNAVVVYGGTPNTFLFDLQSGSIDLTPYQTKALATSVVGETTVEGALSGLDTKETNDIKDVYEVMGKNGAKNLFPTNKTYYNGRSYTNNGITFVQNDDGSITVSGIATADAQYTLFTRVTDWGINIDVGNSYILSGCPSGGSNDTYRLVFGDTQSSAYHRLAIDIGEGAEFTITTASEQYYASSIDVRNGVDLTTPITFYPMLRPASDTDSTYQPYAKTNQKLTTDTEALTNQANDMVNVYGAKNLIPYPYHRQNGYTTNDATFTYDDDGVVTVNKTVGSATAYFAFFSNILYPNAKKFLEPNTSYILSMELEDATNTSCFVQIQNGSDIAAIRNKATGKYETLFTTTETIDSLTLGLYYGAEATENNAKVKLMIRTASIQDDTYEPYSKTNRELTTDKAEQTEVDDIVNVYGAKNLIPYPYNSTDGVYNAVTYSSDKNGVITVSGTAGTANANFYLTDWRGHNLYIEAGQTYRLTGCPSGGSTGTYCLCIFTFNDDGTEVSPTQRYYETGNGLTFTPNVSGVVRVYFRVASGKTAPSDKIYPMLRLATIKDDNYIPYAPTNAKLNEEKMSYADNGVLGAKNVLKNNIASITRNGVTYTLNSDGTFVANGTATANGGIEINANINGSLIEGMRYKVSLDGVGADKDGTQNGIMMYVAKYLNGTNVGDVARSNKTSGFTDEFVYHKDSSFDSLHVGCYTFKDASFNNSTIKPMIRIASDSDDTYQPYAMTNKELTDAITKSFEESFNVDDLYIGQGVSKAISTSLTQQINMGTLGNAIKVRTFQSSGNTYSEEVVYYSGSGIRRVTISGTLPYTATTSSSTLTLTISNTMRLAIERIG